MRLRSSALHLVVALALAASALGAACGGEPLGASFGAAAAESYVGRWSVAEPLLGPIPLGLHLSRTGRGLAARVTYSGVAYDAAGSVGAGGFDLRQLDGHTRLTGKLRRDGRLDVTLDNLDPAASSVPVRVVLEREPSGGAG